MQSVYYNSLGFNTGVYNAALNCFRNRAKGFAFSGSLNPSQLCAAVLNDHPELFYVSQEILIKSTFLGREILPYYVYSPSETTKIQKQLDDVARMIISENINDHQSDYDNVRALHDYLKKNLEYDTVGANSRRHLYEVDMAETHNIVGALLRNKCVCEGFAKSMKFLCDKIGLECWVVSGTGNSTIGSGPHAWNIVKINGYYHHVDVTWDNQYSDSSELPNYGYLNLSDDEISRDHTWNRSQYPKCENSPYNYFRVNNALIDCRAQLESVLYEKIQMEEDFIMFRVVRGSVLEREINGCLEDCINKAAARCKHVSVPTFRYGSIPEQLTYYIQPDYEY